MMSKLNLMSLIVERIKAKYKHVLYLPYENKTILVTNVEIWVDEGHKEMINIYKQVRPVQLKSLLKKNPIYLCEL